MKILSQAIIVFIVRLSFKIRLLSHAPPLSHCPPTTPKLSCHVRPPLLVRLQGHCSALAPLSLPHPPPLVFWFNSLPPCSFGSRGKGFRSARCLLSCSFPPSVARHQTASLRSNLSPLVPLSLPHPPPFEYNKNKKYPFLQKE